AGPLCALLGGDLDRFLALQIECYWRYRPAVSALPYPAEGCLRSRLANKEKRFFVIRYGLEVRKRATPKGNRCDGKLLKFQRKFLAGAVGFEPTVHGTKNRCLTTWPRPNCVGVSSQAVRGVQEAKRKNLVDS